MKYDNIKFERSKELIRIYNQSLVIQRKPGHAVSTKNPTRIGTWNVRTVLSPGRLEELKQQMREK